YCDVNHDGFTSDDMPKTGVTIKLYTDLNGVLTDTGKSQVTAANGTYTFSNLGQLAGGKTYAEREVGPYESVLSATRRGATTTAGYNPNTTGQDSNGNDFDNFYYGHIFGSKYKDITANGISSDDKKLSDSLPDYVSVEVDLYDANTNTL